MMVTLRQPMKRADLEHLIRAAATIADDDELIVVGSQAVLAQFPNAPEEMLRSGEADIDPKNRPERWELIDSAISKTAVSAPLRALILELIERDFLFP